MNDPLSKPSFRPALKRGSDLDVESITKSMREYWPPVKNWREMVSQPLPYFTNFGVAYQLTGRDKVGKSHLASIIAAKHSKSHDVLYVTTEFPAELIHQKLISLGADPDHLLYLDYSEDPHNVLGVAKLGSVATPFFKTRFYRDFTSAVTTMKGDPIIVIVDSLTSFYEAQEWSGRLLAGNLIRTIRKTPNVLAIVISQKRTQHSEYTTEVAGGLGVSHILDGTFIMAKYRLSRFRRLTSLEQALLKTFGGAVHTFRWDGCRWGPHPEDEFVIRFIDGDAEVYLNLTRSRDIMNHS